MATAGLLAVLVLYMVGDALCGDDTSTPTFRMIPPLWHKLMTPKVLAYSSTVWRAARRPWPMGVTAMPHACIERASFAEKSPS